MQTSLTPFSPRFPPFVVRFSTPQLQALSALAEAMPQTEAADSTKATLRAALRELQALCKVLDARAQLHDTQQRRQKQRVRVLSRELEARLPSDVASGVLARKQRLTDSQVQPRENTHLASPSGTLDHTRMHTHSLSHKHKHMRTNTHSHTHTNTHSSSLLFSLPTCCPLTAKRNVSRVRVCADACAAR